MDDEVMELARRMYDECPTVKPTWDQLSDVTRQVWVERARERIQQDLAAD